MHTLQKTAPSSFESLNTHNTASLLNGQFVYKYLEINSQTMLLFPIVGHLQNGIQTINSYETECKKTIAAHE